MRFTTIFFLTASLVNVAFSYTAKELDALQQYLVALGSGIDTITADLIPFSGAGGTISKFFNIQVDDEESQELVISTLASYYTIARNAVNGFIDGKFTFDQLGVTPLVKPILTEFISGLYPKLLGTLVNHISPELLGRAIKLQEEYKALGDEALAAFS
ncbi:uncharacterized protein LACBIDRAFT_294590 [Laccaria bicolor S238N-H82]|uniref:Predicted protein n=1 Tax=Laccaria bicolor (strain S238N-H82 / ATCC MYA-4686) TaxID=486041 RepID=B0DEY0_LACBS|nr:uncharacterized protein LACBIDRAFT_294590 [Laccaria bicolor S238N-H82]EDR06749.1 predicted protein [Laccaria bicolor S238N-H82]|eukprot:XP_001882596.1 predicted protein [Laccaria bicolor S238N-H82]